MLQACNRAILLGARGKFLRPTVLQGACAPSFGLRTTALCASSVVRRSISETTSRFDELALSKPEPVVLPEPPLVFSNPDELDRFLSFLDRCLFGLVTHAEDALVRLHSFISADGTLFGWWGTLVATSILLRAALFPLVCFNRFERIKLLQLPEGEKLRNIFRSLRGSPSQKLRQARQLRKLALESVGTSRLRLIRYQIFIGWPASIVLSLAIRRLALSGHEGWDTGGLFWFHDLTVMDPVLILPIAFGAMVLKQADAVNISNSYRRLVSTEKPGDAFSNMWSTAFQAFYVFFFPYYAPLPAGVQVYWLTSSLITAAERKFFSSSSCRELIGLESYRRTMRKPPSVLTQASVSDVKKQLDHVKDLLSAYKHRKVDDKLAELVDNLLRREKESGVINLNLRAVIKNDKKSGDPYLSIVETERRHKGSRYKESREC